MFGVSDKGKFGARLTTAFELRVDEHANKSVASGDNLTVNMGTVFDQQKNLYKQVDSTWESPRNLRRKINRLQTDVEKL